MGLLHWCTVSPAGPSRLAAIRFTAPIRVSSIRIFPNGAQPFLESPEVIAHTEPEAFYAEVFFNAHPLHPVPPSESKEKQRAPNALVPTAFGYAGGQVDFTVDMGTEYATRLMIVKGQFESLSMAIYGDIVSEAPHIQKYDPRPMPSVEPFPLSKAVDPSNSSDPTLLANELLALIPNSPPLSLVIRLMFCLKPSNEDWDLPEFPYLHANLQACFDEDFDLETSIQLASKPVRDDSSYDTLSHFAKRIADLIGPKSADQAYCVAKLLSLSASQHSDMARSLLKHLELSEIFDAELFDETTLLRLLEAATNGDVAQHLNNQPFYEMLREVQSSSNMDKDAQVAARRLADRIRGWHSFEDALSNTRGDFVGASKLLKDVGTDEQSIGIWLESMVLNDNFITKLLENPVLPSQSHPPFLLRNTLPTISHDEFIVFVRAYIGVASVLAVWAWTDSLGHDVCRERTLALLQLWQGVDGYREIVNHLLLLRQLTRRLEWITTDNDPPRKSGILAEQVLADLAKDPQAILKDDLVKTILNLKPPLSFIAEHDRLSMRKIALVAEDGLPAAMEELTFSSDHPLSLRRLRTLRVSLAIVERELEDDKGEWRVLQSLWEEQYHGFVPRLVGILAGIGDDLNGHFALSPPPRMNQTLADQLFRTADDVLRLIMLLSPAFPLTSRELRMLTTTLADILACTDAADMAFSPISSACISAQGTRQIYLDLVRNLAGLDSFTEPGKLSAEIILHTLLEHGLQSKGRDPAYHLLQVFTMIDHILPEPDAVYDDGQISHWVISVLPNVLSEIKAFFRLLDAENQVHFIKRLVRLDNGIIGMGEWLLVEELKHLSQMLQDLTEPMMAAELCSVKLHQVSVSLHFLRDLITPTSVVSSWCIHSITKIADLAIHLTVCLKSLLDGYYNSPYLADITQQLGRHQNVFDDDLKLAICLSLLRTHQEATETLDSLDTVLQILKGMPSSSTSSEVLRFELGRTFSALADAASALDPGDAEILATLLEWLSEQDNTSLVGISTPAFSQLCQGLQIALTDRSPAIADLQAKVKIQDGGDSHFSPVPVNLSAALTMSLQTIEGLLRTDIATPSTPSRKGGNNTPDILGVVISPPTALLRSPAATGLTKTYAKNDFRQLRQAASARQNTSRLPSMHVDDYEVNISPSAFLVPLPGSPEHVFQGVLGGSS